MAVAGTQHRQPALAGPTLGQQLLARVQAEATRAFSRLGPDVEAGPDRAQMPAGARGSQQQGAALGRLSRVKHPAKNGERMPINSQPNWRDGSHTDTLCTNFPAAANRFHERHHSRHG